MTLTSSPPNSPPSPDRRRGQTAARSTSMASPAGSCRRSRPSAKSRINQNPFSAQFDRLGYGRVEVFTKPGTDKFHGSAQLNANDSSFNTGNPLLNLNPLTGTPFTTPIRQPPYHTIFFLREHDRPADEERLIYARRLAAADPGQRHCEWGDRGQPKHAWGVVPAR